MMEAKKRKEDWHSHGDYMNSKLKKLDKQFSVIEMDNHERKSDIFKGVVIFIDGYTNPSADDLRCFVCHHGGKFQQYYSRSIVTHIIATNLPDSKITEIRDKKIIHPQWILESIKQSCLLSIEPYILYDGRQAGQKQLNFTSRKKMVCETRTHQDSLICSKAPYQTTNQTSDFLPSDKPNMKSLCNNLLLNDEITKNHTNDFVDTSGKQRKETFYGDKNVSQKPTKTGNANFVNEYYKFSRLHYLSTWGAELKQFTSELRKSKINNGIIVASKHASPGYYGRVIMHVDLDCFFVSVGIRDKPEFVGKPVAVCHSGTRNSGVKSLSTTNFTSMSEIASCSYEARKAGVHNGMFLGAARKLCPGIVCIPYHFQQYREVSKKLYQILVGYTHDIEAVSCDEAYIDVSLILDEHISPVTLAEQIREEIKHETRCTASIGIAQNMLLARLCTRVAKPNGQYWLQNDGVQTFIAQQKVADLPGVGSALREKLHSMGVRTCADLQTIPLQSLQNMLGDKTGSTFYRYGRGEDDRHLRVEQERKSVSAEINYGIRFAKDSEPIEFINELSQEVHKRLASIGLKGQSVTLKLKVKREGATQPCKYMGHGICDNIARSALLPAPTDDAKTIAAKCHSLLLQLQVLSSDIRGMGVQVNKLTSHKAATKTLHDFVGETTRYSEKHAALKSDVTSLTHTHCNLYNSPRSKTQAKPNISLVSKETSTQHNSNLPPLPKFSLSPPSVAKQRDELEQPNQDLEYEGSDVMYKDLVLPSFSQLDASTVSALPSNIRQHIQRQYGTSLDTDAMKTSNENPQLVQEKLLEIQPNLAGNVASPQIKDRLKKWTETSTLHQEDIDVVVQYFMHLVESKNIENTWILIKFLKRCISKQGDRVWTSAGDQIVQRIQQYVIDRHGAPLAV